MSFFDNPLIKNYLPPNFFFLEIPVSILKKLEDNTFPEGTGATLECELSKYNVTVKWTKVRKLLNYRNKRLLQVAVIIIIIIILSALAIINVINSIFRI